MLDLFEISFSTPDHRLDKNELCNDPKYYYPHCRVVEQGCAYIDEILTMLISLKNYTLIIGIGHTNLIMLSKVYDVPSSLFSDKGGCVLMVGESLITY